MIYLITIKDIAQAAGVSTATVSNVINNKTKHVSQQTIQLINDIIKESDYTPNIYARSLVSNSSNLIVYAETRESRNLLNNLFRSQLMDALEYHLFDNGYNLILKSLTTVQDFETFLKSWNINAIIYNSSLSPDFEKLFASLSIPVCIFNRSTANHHFINVGIDDYKAAVMAVEYLYNKGHRHIAYATPGIKGSTTNTNRANGYIDTIKRLKLSESENLLFECSNENFFDLGKQIAKTSATAVFAQSDALAISLVTGLRSAGKKVPEDVSIIGFDNLEIDHLIYPPLTSVDNDPKLYAKETVNVLLNLIDSKDRNINKNYSPIVLPTRIVERESVREIEPKE